MARWDLVGWLFVAACVAGCPAGEDTSDTSDTTDTSDSDTDTDVGPCATVECDDGLDCTVDGCDPETGDCIVVDDSACDDDCPDDPNKTAPGWCGCGVVEDPADADLDGVPDCADACPDDLLKIEGGACGCGEIDVDSDFDGVADCIDGCLDNETKTDPGLCGCALDDEDVDENGAIDCLQLDECTEDAIDCGPNRVCLDTPDAYVCVCAPGFSGADCDEVDACAQNGVFCEPLSECVNVGFGAYECACQDGFERDRNGDCVDIDECARDLDGCGGAYCTNRFGTYECGCNPRQGGSCDIYFNCADDPRCTSCDSENNWLECLACEPGYSPQPILGLPFILGCLDTNECATMSVPTATYIGEDTSEILALECVNTEGSYRLGCPEGFVGSGGATPTTCTDVDECAEDPDRCGVGVACTNTLGAFACDCPEGSELDGGTCVDIDECATVSCGPNATCVDGVGDYECTCGSGAVLNASGWGCRAMTYAATLQHSYCEAPTVASVGGPVQIRCRAATVSSAAYRYPQEVEPVVRIASTSGAATPTFTVSAAPTPFSFRIDVAAGQLVAGAYDVEVEVDGQLLQFTGTTQGFGPTSHRVTVSDDPSLCGTYPFQAAGSCTSERSFGANEAAQIAGVRNPSRVALAELIRVAGAPPGGLELEFVRDGFVFGRGAWSAARTATVRFDSGQALVCGVPPGTYNGFGSVCTAVAALPGASPGVVAVDLPDALVYVDTVIVAGPADDRIAGDKDVWDAADFVGTNWVVRFGHDVVFGHGGADEIAGDVMGFVGRAGVFAEFGDDILVVGGPSTVYGDARTATAGFNAGDDEIRGSSDDDVLYGDVSVITGAVEGTIRDGHDELEGGGGDDLMYGSIPGRTKLVRDSFLFDLAAPFGADVLPDAGSLSGDTLVFFHVPDVDQGGVGASDLLALTVVEDDGFGDARVRVFSDVAHGELVGTVSLPSLAFAGTSLADYDIVVEARDAR